MALNQLANILRRAVRENQPFPTSIRAMDWQTASELQGWFYATRWGRLPPKHSRARLRAVFRYARLALLARCHDGPWWALDDWQPRCDPRIPLSAREPLANYGCSPGQITQPWLREAAKWYLGTQLEAGALRWTTVSQERLKCLRRFDNWITGSLADPSDVLGDPADAGGHAAAFRRWTADPSNRMTREADRRHYAKPVHPRQVNDDLRAVAELFAFVAGNQVQARAMFGISPWERVTDTHAANWIRQVSRIPHTPTLNDRHYIDDHALAQIPAALLAELGLPIHVLQRYAGHATPTMSMHYVAQREEHAEQAFLATTKLKADGSRVQFSREDHDTLHLFERADRFLPNGWCLLPPLQTCDKGNACLTCSVFVTDQTHNPALARQLKETEELIARTTAAFQQRHDRAMPEDNVWLAQRRAEHAALTRLLTTMTEHPGRAVQGGGCGPAAAGPVPLTLDLDRHRRTQP